MPKAKKLKPEEKIKEKQVGSTTYQHKYQHYCFECECHPDDHAHELEKHMEERHV